jgi:hypothetical protein
MLVLKSDGVTTKLIRTITPKIIFLIAVFRIRILNYKKGGNATIHTQPFKILALREQRFTNLKLIK